MAEIHQSDPERRPDDEFEPGSFVHLVVGNQGRLLDGRRTPVRVAAIDDRTGQFTIEILAFEDVGGTWDYDFEKIGNLQFERGGARNDETRVAEIRGIATLFDRAMTVPIDPAARAGTDRRLARETDDARRWLREHSGFLASGDPLPDSDTREGDPRLLADFERFITKRGLWDIEEPFAARFVSAPLGERIKGHRLVIAELGLVAYDGKVVRDATIFDGPWSKARRAEHIVARLAFIRALAAALGIDHFTLYRGISSEGELTAPPNETFISASFARAVAESIAGAYGDDAHFRLLTREVPVDRVFMTYQETSAMNRQFMEAEAVLLYEPGNPMF